MKLFIALPVAAAAMLAAHSRSPVCDAGAPVAFMHADVLTMERPDVLRDQIVVVTSGSISALGVSAAVPSNACRIDASGRVLMPGLADMHVHTAAVEMPLYLANGITLAREMNGSPDMVSLRDRIRSGSAVGPRLIVASPLLTAQKLPYRHRFITSAEDALAAAHEAKAAGYDLLKIYDGLTLEEYDALRAAGDSLHLPLDGHIPQLVGLEAALDAHQTIEHTDKVVNALTGHELDTAQFARLRSLFAAKPVWFVPTIASLRALAMAGTPEYRDRMAAPNMAYVDSATIGYWNTLANGRSRPDAPGAYYSYELATIRALRDVGTRMLLGTDCGNPLMVCGFAVYDELLALTRDAHFTNYEALRMATANVGEFLQETYTGVIRVGARGDVILLDGNPITDLATLQRPRGVLVNGRWFDRTALDDMLQKAKLR